MKIDIAIGIATAVQLLVIPRPMKAQPSSFISFRNDPESDRSVLNILQQRKTRINKIYIINSIKSYSLRITSNGLVRAAPASPAATDLIAERVIMAPLS